VAWEARDDTVVRVVFTWLEVAADTGEPPSARAVAERIGMSHTAVSDAMERFKKYLPRGTGDS
jgi:hypothetical protein